MTGHKGNSEFCFPETLKFPEAKPRGTLRSITFPDALPAVLDK